MCTSYDYESISYNYESTRRRTYARFNGIFFGDFITSEAQDILGPLAVAGDFSAHAYTVNTQHGANCTDVVNNFNGYGLIVGTENASVKYSDVHVNGAVFLPDGSDRGNVQELDKACSVYNNRGTGLMNFTQVQLNAIEASTQFALMTPTLQLDSDGNLKRIADKKYGYDVITFGSCDACDYSGANFSSPDAIYYGKGMSWPTRLIINGNQPSLGMHVCNTVLNFYPSDDVGFYQGGAFQLDRSTGGQLGGFILLPEDYQAIGGNCVTTDVCIPVFMNDTIDNRPSRNNPTPPDTHSDDPNTEESSTEESSSTEDSSSDESSSTEDSSSDQSSSIDSSSEESSSSSSSSNDESRSAEDNSSSTISSEGSSSSESISSTIDSSISSESSSSSESSDSSIESSSSNSQSSDSSESFDIITQSSSSSSDSTDSSSQNDSSSSSSSSSNSSDIDSSSSDSSNSSDSSSSISSSSNEGSSSSSESASTADSSSYPVPSKDHSTGFSTSYDTDYITSSSTSYCPTETSTVQCHTHQHHVTRTQYQCEQGFLHDEQVLVCQHDSHHHHRKDYYAGNDDDNFEHDPEFGLYDFNEFDEECDIDHGLVDDDDYEDEYRYYKYKGKKHYDGSDDDDDDEEDQDEEDGEDDQEEEEDRDKEEYYY
ncbi:hypothetical protein FB192DRAFT_1464672 [Mucor lusitanicus]|uniref:Uncharacterized protein n=1 Tax=Mucor circinelloides f. lusitanicus TaxID=29924 RepID=A0A8H4BQB5_MUCCL|nr:hypothetical protein FB192DRAFT_1464672 [Mucor lusitanicus]